MNVRIKQLALAEGELETKTMKLICVPVVEKNRKDEALLCIKSDLNFSIANVYLGDKDNSIALCEEICRRFNEFPEELKR